MASIPLPIARQVFPMPATAQAIYDSALYVQSAWIAAAQSGQFVETNTGAYVRGIQTAESLVYPCNGDALAAAVVNVAPHAMIVEEGHPGFHLPSVIDWGASRAARRSNKGLMYLRIPFRHTTPRSGPGVTPQAQRTMMPRQVYAVAKTLPQGQRLTAGPSRGQAVHAPGLRPYQPRTPRNVRPGYQPASIFEGMRREGARGQRRYMTYRTLTQQSPGWHIPPRAGTFLAATVARETTPHVLSLMGAAFAQDLEAQMLRLMQGDAHGH